MAYPAAARRARRAADRRVDIKRLVQQPELDRILFPQPEVSHLMNGHFSRFTTDKLLDFLKRLDRKVTIQIGPHKLGEPYREIGFAS